jgi:hypothetical protein
MKKEMARLYGVSVQTFSRWISPHNEKIGAKQGYYFSINQVRIIFEILGEP